jgi:hypothetical protein
LKLGDITERYEKGKPPTCWGQEDGEYTWSLKILKWKEEFIYSK